MKLSNISYDRLKWFALVFIPAFEVLILTLGKIWGIDSTDLNRPLNEKRFTDLKNHLS